jgi:hypothetical protein
MAFAGRRCASDNKEADHDSQIPSLDQQPLDASAAGLTGGDLCNSPAVTWPRYGRHDDSTADERDALLDAFMPHYEVVERHHIAIRAPAMS